jgi:predicted DNA-binding transcriptional regulator AlpA
MDAVIKEIEPFLVDAEFAGRLIGVSRTHFLRLDRTGRLGPSCIKLGRCRRWSTSQLKEWMSSGRPSRRAYMLRQRRKQMKTYFVQALKGGPIKIGASVRPELRIKRLQIGNPLKLHLLCVLPGNKEKELHREFEGLSLEGEWFEDDGQIKEWIERQAVG